MGNFGLLTTEICWRVWGTPRKFQLVSRLGFVTAQTLLNGGQQNFAGCLAISLAGILYMLYPVYTIQPVVKQVVQPGWQPAVLCRQTSNPFDNRLYRV